MSTGHEVRENVSFAEPTRHLSTLTYREEKRKPEKRENCTFDTCVVVKFREVARASPPPAICQCHKFLGNNRGSFQIGACHRSILYRL